MHWYELVNSGEEIFRDLLRLILTIIFRIFYVYLLKIMIQMINCKKNTTLSYEMLTSV